MIAKQIDDECIELSPGHSTYAIMRAADIIQSALNAHAKAKVEEAERAMAIKYRDCKYCRHKGNHNICLNECSDGHQAFEAAILGREVGK